jgi:replicative DNA helicase
MSTEAEHRILKHAEKILLGMILLDDDALEIREVANLHPGEFFEEAHSIIFDVMLALHKAGDPVDLVTVCEVLQKHGELDAVGGPSYLSSLTDGFPRSSMLKAGDIALIVRSKAEEREEWLIGVEREL